MHNKNKERKIVEFRKKSPATNVHFLVSVPLDCMSEVEKLENTQDAANKFYEIVNYLMNTFFPVKRVTVTNKDPEYMTAELKSMLRKKNRLMRRGKIEEADAVACKIGNLVAKDNASRLKSLETNDNKGLWKEVNKIIKKDGGGQDYDIGITANDLNVHYAATSTDMEYEAPRKKLTCNAATLKIMDEHNVFFILDNLKRTSSGPDEIPVWFLRLAAPFLSKALAHLYNLSISEGTVPTQWKSAIITPVPKIKNPAHARDFRPNICHIYPLQKVGTTYSRRVHLSGYE